VIRAVGFYAAQYLCCELADLQKAGHTGSLKVYDVAHVAWRMRVGTDIYESMKRHQEVSHATARSAADSRYCALLRLPFRAEPRAAAQPQHAFVVRRTACSCSLFERRRWVSPTRRVVLRSSRQVLTARRATFALLLAARVHKLIHCYAPAALVLLVGAVCAA